MSLYFDAVNILTEPASGGSFKSRIYSARDLRAQPAQIYALIIEASKWDRLLAEVIDRSELLKVERKLTPLLALLLVHDLLIAKKGISAPTAHTIRQNVERHKVRLKAEFTKARVRRGCATVEQLKAAVLREKRELNGTDDFVYPRWVRVNNIRSSLEVQLSTTFSAYRRVDSLAELAQVEDDRSARQLIYMDPHIPELVAVPYGADFTSSAAYKNGEIILQDKASCFPAYLLLGDRGMKDAWQGHLVDGCAAPGNKTTHMASLLAKQEKQKTQSKQIISMDASRMRSKTLKKMVAQAGADNMVTVLQGQDFLALDPMDSRFEEVTGLLLDPSCSGSGIIGRDDVPEFTLPQAAPSQAPNTQGKKRKRPADDDQSKDQQKKAAPIASNVAPDPEDENDIPSGTVDQERLVKLSNLQARIVEHALTFPNATHVTYSTCSIHLIENESVVERILASKVAKEGGWRLLRRNEQPDGLRKWQHRGVRRDRDPETKEEVGSDSLSVDLSDEDLDACLRCWSGDAEGLGGFFVAGFIRDPQLASSEALAQSPPHVDDAEGVKNNKEEEEEEEEEEDDDDDDSDDDEWGGFSD
ncbi:hypothetical protein N7478_009329 [Penicillium angulare]|uniref:uncharacterized protein n=1 Tax=Penicillium angulare TaxID=116970 RepID=UPI00254213AD|nr:uncharacterized protein N7478_009329 [Penicillium angulare]KAJ5266521.1 hypothetical protein N7478_009329 [Penicillium angulare]